MSDPFIAEIRIFPLGFAPKGWASCDGQLLPISQNPALFSLLGTIYGGNGTSNFALPNFRGTVMTSTSRPPMPRRPVRAATCTGGRSTATRAVPARSSPTRRQRQAIPGSTPTPSLLPAATCRTSRGRRRCRRDPRPSWSGGRSWRARTGRRARSRWRRRGRRRRGRG